MSLFPSDQTEIRLGTSMPGGPTDFSQFELLGTSDDPEPSEWRTFSVTPPKKVKFLAILQTGGTKFEIAFLEFEFLFELDSSFCFFAFISTYVIYMLFHLSST